MASAVDFFPSCSKLLMNLATTTSWNFGSGRISRLRTDFLRPISITSQYLLCSSSAGSSTLRAILRTALLAVCHALSVERSANGVITNTRKVLHTASADQHDRVFLKVVSD